MATSLNVIRTLTLRAVATGFEAAAAAANNLAGAQNNVATASANQTKSTLSADAALQKLQRRYDQEARAQQDLAKAQQQLERARSQGLISQAEQNRLMQLAIAHHNGSASAAGKHSQALQELSTISQGLSGNLGTVGGIMARMGPAGLAIAATIGGAALAFGVAASASLQLAEDMGKLADTAETIGITVEQLRALQLAAGEVGVSSEQLDTNLTKFTSVLGQVRDGSQSAYDSFNRLGAGLGDSVRSAKNEEQALNLVFEALRKADTASAALGARELFGKSGSGMVRLANATTTIQALADSMNKLDIVTGTQAKTWDDLGDRINKNMSLAGTNVKASFATPVLEALNQVAKVVLEVSRAIRQAAQDLGFNIDTSSIESFRVDLQILNIEIAKFGAARAVTDLSDRLFGSNFTNVATAVIAIIKSLASAFADLVNIISSAIAALASFATGDFAGVARQTASVTASYQNLSDTISNFAASAKAARKPVVDLNTVTVQAGASVFDNLRPWIETGNLIEKVGEITPPVTNNINKLGAANDFAAGKTKKLKEETEKVDPVLKELGQVAGQLGSALVSAFLKGDNAAKALKGTLQSISSSAASSAITKLVQQDFAGAAVGPAAGGTAAEMFGGATKAKPEKQPEKRDERDQCLKAA
jgi:hypothetical protein